MQIKKSIPNIISVLRIVLSFVLFLTLNEELLFSCLVLLIGLSDVADGYIARKYHLVSKLGAKLDSLADLIFFAILLVILYLRYEWILSDNYLWFLIIVVLKISTAVISRIKSGEVQFIHTLANKLTGLLVFLSLLILPFNVPEYLFTGVFIIATLAAAEELGIVIVHKKVDLNHVSIFKK
jgi:phosphatidylglycerophosphate synthase